MKKRCGTVGRNNHSRVDSGLAVARRPGMTGEKMSKGQVGIIGLGIMGGAIAKNLAAAGWQVVGFDITKERCDEAKAAGVEIVGDAAMVAERSANILVSLPT